MINPIKLLTLILALGLALLAAEPVVPKPAPNQTQPTPIQLKPDDLKRLNDLDSTLKTKSEARRQLGTQYQQAVIDEQSLALQLSDQIRSIERVTCGVREAFGKQYAVGSNGGWVCTKIPDPSTPPPFPSPPSPTAPTQPKGN